MATQHQYNRNPDEILYYRFNSTIYNKEAVDTRFRKMTLRFATPAVQVSVKHAVLFTEHFDRKQEKVNETLATEAIFAAKWRRTSRAMDTSA
jgi:hypothetical protein